MRFPVCLSILLPLSLFGQATSVRFEPASYNGGPFPTDALTVPDALQKTGRRVALPLPDCVAQPGAYGEVEEINRLDGFDIAPRLRVRFSSAVNVDTLRDGVFLVALENLA